MLKMKVLPCILASVFLVLALFVGCSKDDEINVTGGVDEQTNTVAGILVDLSGNAVSGVQVSARYMGTKAVEFSDTTDENGRFGFPLVRVGQYGILAEDDSTAYYECIKYDGDSINLSATLVLTTQVKGRLNLRPDTSAAFVQISIPGTGIGTETAEDGSFELDKVPMGIVAVYAASPDPERFGDAVYVLNLDGRDDVFYGPVPKDSLSSFMGALAERMLSDSLAVDSLYEHSLESEAMQFPLSVEYGLRSWWSMDYLSSGANFKTMSDVRGWTEDMVVYGDVVLEEGVDNKALALSLADQYGVIEEDRGLLDSVSAFVFEAWVNIKSIDSTAESYRKNIVGKLGFGSEQDQDVFSFALVNGVCGASHPSLAFFLSEGKTGDSLSCENSVVSQREIEVGSWIYVTVVWDGEKMTLYLDGVPESSKDISFDRLGISDEPIFFGKESIGLMLDDVRFGAKPIDDHDVLYRFYLKGGVR